MKKIGVISDTHGYIDKKALEFFKDCDEIWHAGDIGNREVISFLEEAGKKVVAVHGNIDDYSIRLEFPEFQRFQCEELNVLMTHIGGYPNHYKYGVESAIKQFKPNLFVSGHSHILRVIYDDKLDLLTMNPGAFGNTGFHDIRTCIRFMVEGSEIKNLGDLGKGKRIVVF